ncbi:hypothetical protein RJ639_016953 [Escallonia herrerae]|uniref:Protein kinase domain-containing protein n=1 Tax=Escallonia herrerae TaxID=1293975 RepID=A0AA88VDM6_9ASTE|nr:hypothetical protein RJ639_016953 [Escallonia herrerae]
MMALIGIRSTSSLESIEVPQFSFNLSTRLIRPTCLQLSGETSNSKHKRSSRVRFSSSKEAVSPLESEEVTSTTSSDSLEEEFSHVTKFEISDFKISDSVCIGLGGRADEAVYEATVNDTHSPLYGTRVVLRRLTSAQAQRRGKRAIQVLKKLARRRLLYHSYSMHVHGYACSPTTDDHDSFTLVHGYHGGFSLRHWLQLSDWLPTLEATLALDEESVRRVGDDTVGGPAVSRQLRLIRILMRDLLIGVNYLHSHGLAHTELRLENVHISPLDRHIKVGIFGNAADFCANSPNNSTVEENRHRREMMIAFDMRCMGFIMAKMVLRELMDPVIFTKFKEFLTQGNDPSCLREFLLKTLHRSSSSGNVGLQILDRNWGAGWNLLNLLLATNPLKRISTRFFAGPRWRIDPSMDIIRWNLGSTAVRIAEEYIYGQQQRIRLAHFVELMEMVNPHSKPKIGYLLPGRWRLLYCTGRHLGLTLRQPPARVLIGDVHLTEDKAMGESLSSARNAQDSVIEKLSGKKWRKVLPFKELPSSLQVAKLISSDVEVSISLNEPLSREVKTAQNVVQEVRTQIPPEMFDLSKIVCGTYVDSRLLVLRGVNGSALLFTRSFVNESHGKV